ncbi:Phytochrome-like protein cph1 [Pseudobythopirellula maris]|uniref:histidine kinase n=1 Tax=Pseudobythopirellula maris TaxID=2527991 RepID=A0A5C5ZRC7_9BACT|nr:sensor histidine kinase [Pseudobythopirellula maris]TWT88813.1 Phytochrome-like protein cph1 [Pseudobythopirellula maris]
MHDVNRIRLLTCGSVLITAVVIGLVSLGGYNALFIDQQQVSLQHQATSDARLLELSLDELRNDAALLGRLSLTKSLLERVAAGDTATADRDRLAEYFEQMIRAKKHYKKVRVFDANGMELLRLNRHEGVVWRAADTELQLKGHRDFFQEAMEVPPKRVYVSKINLNHDQGGIEVPHRPMLRTAQRIDGQSGRPIGVVVINMHFGEFIDNLLDLADDTRLRYMTNDSGDYLVHPDESKTYGFDLGKRHRIQDDHPAIAEFFNDDSDSTTIWNDRGGTDGGRVLVVRKTRPFPDEPDRFVTVGVEAMGDTLARDSRRVLRWAAITTGLLIIGALLLGLAASRLQTHPLESLTVAAQRLEEGGTLPELPMKHKDEVGDLARAFHKMAERIRVNESQLQETNARLETANDDLKHFVHIAAHDLREPLRKLRNLVDLLQMEDGQSDPLKAEELLGCVSKCSLDMQALIDDFRALTKVEETHLVREPVALDVLISEVLSSHAKQIRARNIVVRFSEFPTKPHVYPGLTSRLYDNLIRNALNHTSSDGFTLTFTAVRTDDLSWEYGVSNTGSSMPDGDRSEFFKLFRKSPDSEGSGVGLSICKKIIDRHRGTITVDSQNNTVHVRFTFGGGADDGKIT